MVIAVEGEGCAGETGATCGAARPHISSLLSSETHVQLGTGHLACGCVGMTVARKLTVTNVDIVIEELLEQRPDGFRNKHLAQALGVSRSRASQLLSARVLSGELARTMGGSAGFIRGPDHPDSPNAGARATESYFWKEAVRVCPQIAYVSIAGLGLTEVRTRRQVRKAVESLPDRTRVVFLDFDGVHSLSRAAAKEIVFGRPIFMADLHPINAEPPVKRALERIRRLGRRR